MRNIESALIQEGYCTTDIEMDGELLRVWEVPLFEDFRLRATANLDGSGSSDCYSVDAAFEVVSSKMAAIEEQLGIHNCFEYVGPRVPDKEIWVFRVTLKWLALKWEGGLDREALVAWSSVSSASIASVAGEVAAQFVRHGKTLRQLMPSSVALAEILSNLGNFPGRAGSQTGPGSVFPFHYAAVLFAENEQFERARLVLQNEHARDCQKVAAGELRSAAKNQIDCMFLRYMSFVDREAAKRTAK